MNKINELIIIGGGYSINNGISTGLRNKISNKLTFGLNFSFKDFISTTTVFVDRNFYKTKKEELLKLPLVIGRDYRGIYHDKAPNILALKATNRFNGKDSIKEKRFYKSSLVGLFSLSIGISLLESGRVFLLGFDFGKITNNKIRDKEITHYYQKDKSRKHTGTGKCKYYKDHLGKNNPFLPFKQVNHVKIYNVSPKSNLNVFEKIDYSTFYKKLSTNKHTQKQLRSYLVKKLTKANKNEYFKKERYL